MLHVCRRTPTTDGLRAGDTDRLPINQSSLPVAFPSIPCPKATASRSPGLRLQDSCNGNEKSLSVWCSTLRDKSLFPLPTPLKGQEGMKANKQHLQKSYFFSAAIKGRYSDPTRHPEGRGAGPGIGAHRSTLTLRRRGRQLTRPVGISD